MKDRSFRWFLSGGLPWDEPKLCSAVLPFVLAFPLLMVEADSLSVGKQVVAPLVVKSDLTTSAPTDHYSVCAEYFCQRVNGVIEYSDKH